MRCDFVIVFASVCVRECIQNTDSIQNNNIESDTTTKAVPSKTKRPKRKNWRACPVNYGAQSRIEQQR